MRKPLIIVTDGYFTEFFIDGKIYGEHIKEIKFEHVGGEQARLEPNLELLADDVDFEPKSDFKSIIDFKDRINKIMGDIK